MEESSNGRLEDTLKVELHDEEKEVVLEDSASSKPDVEFVRETVADGEDSSSSSSSSDEEAEPEERGSQMENSENIEEEKVVYDPVQLEPGVSLTEQFSQDIEPSIEKSGDSDVAEIDAKETEEKISPSLDETNAADSLILTDLLINGLKEETEQLSYAETTRDSALLTDVESKGIDETNGSIVAADDAMSMGIEEKTISCLAGNGEAVVAQGITESKLPASDNNAGGSSGSPDLASKENVEDSLQAANVPIVETTRDAGESMGNQPIISLSHRPMQPTSWKSCCGLFEVLRRSNR